MKRLLFVLTLGAALACPAFAQSTNTPPSGPPPDGFHKHDRGMGFLTEAEKAELKKAHDAAIAADPSLATEEQTLHETMKADRDAGTPPSDADKQKMHDFRDKMDAAMIAADPAVAPIIAKIKAHHRGPGDHDGGPGNGGSTPPSAQ